VTVDAEDGRIVIRSERPAGGVPSDGE